MSGAYLELHSVSEGKVENEGEISPACVVNIDEIGITEVPDPTASANDQKKSSRILAIQNRVLDAFTTNEVVIKFVFTIVIVCLYFAYFGYAISLQFGDEGSVRLVVVTILVVLFLLLRLVFDWRDGTIPKALAAAWEGRHKRLFKWLYYGFMVAFAVFALLYVILDVIRFYPKNGIPLAGIAFFIISFYIFSYNPAAVRWRPVIWGLYIQFAFACIILRWRFGFQAFQWLGDRVSEFLAYSDAGAKFVFGDDYLRHFFAFKVLPVLVFFSTVVSILYYLGVMQFVIRVIAKGMGLAMGTSPAESLNAAGNIFVGQNEAPLLIRPIIKHLTMSELHAVMTGGFATIAGSVMAAYILYGVPANHLLAASVMSAPAALAMSKLFYPEMEKVTLTDQQYEMEETNDRNLIDAASNGATNSIKLVASIAVNLIAFLSLLAFVNATLAWFGARAGLHDPPLTFELICSYVFYPMSFLMGVDSIDCRRVGELIGVKTFLNEFVAYSRLSVFVKNRKYFTQHVNADYNNYVCSDPSSIYFPAQNHTLTGGMLTIRSEVVATYALCGFANIGSMGIVLGSLGALAPSRKADYSRIVLRAMIAGNVACFMTACIAGILLEPSSIPLDSYLESYTLCGRYAAAQ